MTALRILTAAILILSGGIVARAEGTGGRPPTKPEATATATATADLSQESDFDNAACRLGLTLLGADYEEIAPISDADQPGCGIARPLRVVAVLPGIGIEGGAVMRCDTARQLSVWTRDFVLPALRRMPDTAPLTGYVPGTGYQCRNRVGDGTARISEHARGTAFDIMALTFADGGRLDIRPRTGDGDMAEAIQRSLRATACLFFTTVLGPGANAAHDDHLHLDLAERRGGFRLCE